MIRTFLVAATALLLSACGETPTTGVQGRTVTDVGCPTPQGSSACPEVPLRAKVTALRAGSGESAAVVESGEDGGFLLDLPPGSYELRAENLAGGPVPTAMPLVVTVEADLLLPVTVRFDSATRHVPPGG